VKQNKLNDIGGVQEDLAIGPRGGGTVGFEASDVCGEVHGDCKSLVPHCVCGAPLEHVSQRARIIRMLEDTDPGWRSRVTGPVDTFFERLVASALVSCDLCDEDVTQSAAVWTCKNGPHTVLHPAAYDVCERCFEKYAGRAVCTLLKKDTIIEAAEAGDTLKRGADGGSVLPTGTAGRADMSFCRAFATICRGAFRRSCCGSSTQVDNNQAVSPDGIGRSIR
jgi:hypothetical protein